MSFIFVGEVSKSWPCFYLVLLITLSLVSPVYCWKPIEWLVKSFSAAFPDRAPDHLAEISPKYYLFRNANLGRTFCETFKYLPETVKNSDWISELVDENGTTKGDLIVVTHGWVGHICSKHAKKWGSRLINNLLDFKPETTRVLFVDWEEGAKIQLTSLYSKAASNSKVVGSAIADYLSASPHFNATNSHCIGFSLGAHVCGFAGKQLRKIPGGRRWGRLTALDPAGAGFDTKAASERVSRDDADFVDVYHSSTVGLAFAIGDTDFFINDLSSAQPGCTGPGSFGRCSHTVAAKFFARSVAFGNSGHSCYLNEVCKKCPNLSTSTRSNHTGCQPECSTVRIGYYTSIQVHGKVNINRSEYCWW